MNRVQETSKYIKIDDSIIICKQHEELMLPVLSVTVAGTVYGRNIYEVAAYFQDRNLPVSNYIDDPVKQAQRWEKINPPDDNILNSLFD